MITAKIIADSVCYSRITTLQLRYPRYIHAELLTHKDLSRNSGSSRAIPIERLIQDVEDDPVFPLEWGKNQPGMQAGELLDEITQARAEVHWDLARECAIRHARKLASFGVHKQIVNRILEPFAHITTLVTATEWHRFFALRLDSAAQPEIQALARAMKEAMDASLPTRLEPGEWHMPYGGPLEASVERCARVSYDRAGQGDGDLTRRLLKSRHLSPFEHQARPEQGRHANLVGWVNYRTIIE